MPTGVHLAILVRFVGNVGKLKYGQRVHIGPQSNHWAILLTFNNRDHTCFPQSGTHVGYTNFFQCVEDEFLCFWQVEKEFRVLVQPVPPRRNFRDQR